MRNAKLLFKQKGGERLDVTHPPPTACNSCRKEGGLWCAPNLSDGVMASSGGAARLLVGVEVPVEETHTNALQPDLGIRSWDEVVQRLCGPKWASPDKDFDALAGWRARCTSVYMCCKFRLLYAIDYKRKLVLHAPGLPRLL